MATKELTMKLVPVSNSGICCVCEKPISRGTKMRKVAILNIGGNGNGTAFPVCKECSYVDSVVKEMEG